VELEFTLKRVDREPIRARDEPKPVGETPRGFKSRPRRYLYYICFLLDNCLHKIHECVAGLPSSQEKICLK